MLAENYCSFHISHQLFLLVLIIFLADGAERMMLTALLCSCHVSEDIRRTIDKNFTLMPLLLVKGPVTLARHLKSWIQVLCTNSAI